MTSLEPAKECIPHKRKDIQPSPLLKRHLVILCSRNLFFGGADSVFICILFKPLINECLPQEVYFCMKILCAVTKKYFCYKSEIPMRKIIPFHVLRRYSLLQKINLPPEIIAKLSLSPSIGWLS